MARISRKNLDTMYYHIMVQGIGKEFIFNDNYLKDRYKKLLYKKSKINDVNIIAYCIMDNHVHILARAEKNEQISKMMLQINSSYGKYYNRMKNRVGYVFRDRYRAEPIFNNTHLQNCIRYIHENPVKAGIVKRCDDYLYSSFNEYKNKTISSDVIKEVYGKSDKYLDNISGNYENYNFIDTSNEFGEQELEKFEIICEEYKNVDFNDEKNVYRVSKEIKRRSNALDIQIMSFMGLKRTRYYKILKSQRKLNF